MTVLDTDYMNFAVIFACSNIDSPKTGACEEIQAHVLSQDRVFITNLSTSLAQKPCQSASRSISVKNNTNNSYNISDLLNPLLVHYFNRVTLSCDKVSPRS